MTNRSYQLQLGGDRLEDVTETTASAIGTGGVVVEANLHFDATGMGKLAAIKGLQAIIEYITRDTYPPV